MFITVYAIAKNEEQFVDRFVAAASEADDICVLDTGSTDRTMDKLREHGCIVGQKIFEPFRFDEARNESMKLIPEDTDICVCVDLDEVLQKGWREKLVKAWTKDAVSAKYTCISSYNADGSPGTAFLREKIHRPGAFRWVYPVHEVLEYTGDMPYKLIEIPDLIAEHLPDPTKSRGQYLPLLELAAKERPDDARSAHYLGREYMYYGRWDDAIGELKRHLRLPSATWKNERSASMRYISECLSAQGKNYEALLWAMKSVTEQPYLRENWYEAEKMSYRMTDWAGVVFYGEHAAAITERSNASINEAEAWGAGVYDLLSLGYWYTKRKTEALHYGEEAAKIAPDDERIWNNLKYYRGEYDES